MRKNLYMLLVILVVCSLISCRRNGKENNNNQVPQNSVTPTESIQNETNQQITPEEMIMDPEAWKEKFPQIVASFKKTSMMGDDIKEDSSLGGSHPFDYLKEYPNISILYEGMGFAKEYYQARGHFYALEDVINISRPKPGATCLACKSSEFEKLVNQNGVALYSTDFQKVVQEVEFGITCYNCHRNTPGEGIQVTSPHLNTAISNLDLKLKPGTLACAQCHVEYYIKGDSKEVVLPWDNGLEVEQIEAYYDGMQYSDWTQPRTGTPLIKVQHPEFEMYSGSVHDQMKVSCASCHMPVVSEEGQEYQSHWVTSPLKNAQATCGSCHGDDIDSVVKTVESIQKRTHNMEGEVSDMLVKLVEDFAQAIEDKKLDDATIEELRGLHRKAQYRWDFVFVENSTGFHNAEKSTKALEDAKNYAQQAIDILDSIN